jgi:ABC-type phosphate transport system substrate-binding protein
MMNIRYLLSSLLLTCYITGSAFAETLVIVNKNAKVETLDKEQIADIYLGKSPTLPNGEQVIAIDYNENIPLRDTFHSATTGKTQSQLKAYWSRLLFSGKGTPPKEVDDEASMKKLVADNPSIIGYISSENVDDSVKVVFRF